MDEIEKEYDAVVLGTGTSAPAKLRFSPACGCLASAPHRQKQRPGPTPALATIITLLT